MSSFNSATLQLKGQMCVQAGATVLMETIWCTFYSFNVSIHTICAHEVLGARQQASQLSCYTSYRLLMLETLKLVRREIFTYDVIEAKKNSIYMQNRKSRYEQICYICP